MGKIDKATETPRPPTWLWTPALDLRQEAAHPRRDVTSVDHDDHNVFVAMTKDQIKGAPDYDANDLDDEAYLKHGDYYRSRLLIGLASRAGGTAARTRGVRAAPLQAG